MDKHKKMHLILNIFQEGIFESFKLHQGDLNFKLECTFLADLINKNYSFFYGVFKNCKDVFFKSWDEDLVITDNLDDILALEPFMLNTEIDNEGYIKVYCNCSKSYTGGNLYIKADDLIIFNEDLLEMDIDDLTEIAEKYWYEVNGSAY